MSKKKTPVEERLIKQPRYVGLVVEEETYDILKHRAFKAGDTISKLIRSLLDKAALTVE